MFSPHGAVFLFNHSHIDFKSSFDELYLIYAMLAFDNSQILVNRGAGQIANPCKSLLVQSAGLEGRVMLPEHCGHIFNGGGRSADVLALFLLFYYLIYVMLAFDNSQIPIKRGSTQLAYTGKFGFIERTGYKRWIMAKE